MQLSRRHLMQIMGVALLAGVVPSEAAELAAKPMPYPRRKPKMEPFSFQSLIAEAQKWSQNEFEPPRQVDHEWLRSLGYDAYRDIRFKSDEALWAGRASNFRAEFFHPGALFLEPVEIYEVAGGQARRLAYDPEAFDFGKQTPPSDLAGHANGYAGFRLHTHLNNVDKWDEFLVFLGASYFRAVGKAENYGLSARGLAVNTATAGGEEFPAFRQFWIERPDDKGKDVTIYALLDSRSISGAFKFTVTPDARMTMQVEAHLFPRKEIERLGIAPLTSMYLLGENDRRMGRDFRPEVHDSDGLMMHTGTDEWLWRPLINPAILGVSSFETIDPKGFGLMQRDRRFDSYQDLEAFYETRPSLWVTPQNAWGKGVVQLVEIPTDREIHDNIVAYWVPASPLPPQQEAVYTYTLDWGDFAGITGVAEVVSTRVGHQFDHDVTKFVIDFKTLIPVNEKDLGSFQIDLWVGQGKVNNVGVHTNPHIEGLRVTFDYEPEAAKIVEMRCTLRQDGKAVSETWCYQWQASK